LIFSTRDAVLVDPLMTVREATALADWVALHERRLITIYINVPMHTNETFSGSWQRAHRGPNFTSETARSFHQQTWPGSCPSLSNSTVNSS
jgi:hypothetical protein